MKCFNNTAACVSYSSNPILYHIIIGPQPYDQIWYTHIYYICRHKGETGGYLII